MTQTNDIAPRIQTMWQRLQRQHRRGLIPFITAGDPVPETTVPLMHALVAAGADLIELGVPFSDPMADGPTIQRASERALARGMNLRRALRCVEEFRQRDATTPVVLMGYLNPIEAMGLEVFAQAAAKAGVDGVLTVDMPPQEGEEYAAVLRAHGLAPIFLLAPTSTAERAKAVERLGAGYVYYVSLKGVTGAGHLDISEVTERVRWLRQSVHLPVAVGFGVKDEASAAAIARLADAVVVGSRLIEEIEAQPEAALERVPALLKRLRAAIDSVENAS